LLEIYWVQRGERAWKLVMTAGHDKQSERLRLLASSLGLEGGVKFRGEVDERELNRICQSASALIFPSRYEGFGIPLIEAMHFGLPIVCGRGGSQLEVAGKAAIYVNVEDPEDIAATMERLTEDAALRHQLVANGKRQLQKFLLRAEIDKLMRFFEKCIEGEFWPGGCKNCLGLSPGTGCRSVASTTSSWRAILFLDLLYGPSACYLYIFGRK
jgi:glycosyltransferase involved in cell wall biosynthesis